MYSKAGSCHRQLTTLEYNEGGVGGCFSDCVTLFKYTKLKNCYYGWYCVNNYSLFSALIGVKLNFFLRHDEKDLGTLAVCKN